MSDRQTSLESINDAQSESTVIVSDVTPTNQASGDQNQRVEGSVSAESILESFAPGSSSNSYTPRDMATGLELLENAMNQNQSIQQNAFISLLREQIDENKNLRVTLADLETRIADLQETNQVAQDKQKLTEENDERLQEVKNFMAMVVDSITTNRDLRSQLRERDEKYQQKVKQLFDEEEKNRQLAADILTLEQKLSSLQDPIVTDFVIIIDGSDSFNNKVRFEV